MKAHLKVIHILITAVGYITTLVGLLTLVVAACTYLAPLTPEWLGPALFGVAFAVLAYLFVWDWVKDSERRSDN